MSILGSILGGFGQLDDEFDRAKAHHRGGIGARDALRETREYEDRLDRLTLVCMAMWELLKERGDLRAEEDLTAKVREIDLRDGCADGKVAKQVKRCVSCDRVMSPRHQTCMYCGAVKLHSTPFDATM